MPPPVTRAFAEFIASARWSDFDEAVRRATRRTFGNVAALAVGASRSDAVDRIERTLVRLKQPDQATVLGRDTRLGAEAAAMVNGFSAHLEDYDDTHLKTVIHPGAPIVPAALALAEVEGVDGTKLLTAAAVGIEVALRFGVGVCPEHFDRAWHLTGTAGHIGAAAAAGCILGLEPDQLVVALGLGATMASGLTAALGTMTKPYHPGKAAADGIQAAWLAQRGFTGPLAPIEGRRGFTRLSSSRHDFEEMLAGLGSSWELELNAFKPYACGIVSHPVIDAAIELRDQIAREDLIASVDVTVNPVVLDVMGIEDPKDGLSTKFSVYHCFAVGYLDGAGGPEEFSDSKALDPTASSLRRRVRTTADPSTPIGAARVVAHLIDGRRIEVHTGHATGSAERPMTDQQLVKKARRLTEPIIGDGTEEFLEVAFAMDRHDVGALTSSARPPASARLGRRSEGTT